MRIRRILLIAAAALAVLAMLTALVYRADWYQRHYGMGFSDRMNIWVYRDGALLSPESYGLRYLDGDSSGEGAKTAGGYSIDSDYGTYTLIITMKGREISSWVENANNWWRTDIRFDLTSQPGGGFRVKRTLHIINDEKMSVETEEWSAE